MLRFGERTDAIAKRTPHHPHRPEEEESRKRAARSTVEMEDVRIERQHNVVLKLRESTGS